MVMRNTVIGTRLHGIATAVSHALGIGCYALFSQFLGNATDIASSAVMVITPMFIDGAWYSLMAVLISQTLLLNFLRRNAIWLDRAIGGLLILIALRVIFGFFTH